MAEKVKKKEELAFDDSVKQNKKGETILGRLSGPCADFIAPTRNGRMYDQEVWEKVFSSEIVNEYFENGGILGELDHPADRSETCLEKVAICMAEKPTKDKDGKLVGYFDILDTPNGRIAYTLAKYGYKLGISSRGTGDVYEDYNGTDHVDPSTYDFQGFDLVLLPAVKAARLKMVESVENKVSFKKALLEQFDRSDDAAKKVMTETLNHLKIDYKQENIDAEPRAIAAEDNGAGVIKELQESLKEQKALQQKVQELQEKLSVCYAKEAKNEEELQKYKSSVVRLSESARSAKALKSKVDSLTEQLTQKDEIIKSQKKRLVGLTEKCRTALATQKSLNESVSLKETRIKELEENAKTAQASSDRELDALKENLEEVKKNSAIKSKEYAEKLARANSLVEHYRKTAKTAVTRYIESKAKMLGISPNEITNRLSENYSFSEIDKLCESLQEYRLNLSKLPVNVGNPLGSSPVKMKVTESKEPIKPTSRFNDEVDDWLQKLAD